MGFDAFDSSGVFVMGKSFSFLLFISSQSSHCYLSGYAPLPQIEIEQSKGGSMSNLDNGI